MPLFHIILSIASSTHRQSLWLFCNALSFHVDLAFFCLFCQPLCTVVPSLREPPPHFLVHFITTSATPHYFYDTFFQAYSVHKSFAVILSASSTPHVFPIIGHSAALLRISSSFDVALCLIATWPKVTFLR